MAFNIFGDAPQSLTGLLGEQATQDLQKKALTTGLINAAIGYIAQPKNQRYGSALPYIGRALLAGQEGAQGVYSGAIKDYELQQKIAEAKRKQEQQAALQGMIAGITDPNERLLAQLDATEYAKAKLKPKERKVEKVGRQLVDVSGETPTVVFTGDVEESNKPTAFIQNYEYAVSKGFKGTPADWQRLNVEAAAQYQAPYKSAEQERQEIETAYKYGTPPSAIPVPKSASMQDVADTAKATGKTTNQVIQDLKSKGIKVQGAK